jgi:hypothetical protein
MLTKLATFIIAISLITQSRASEPPRSKALIEFGWDEPNTSFLLNHLAELERTPFDGCVFHVDAKDTNLKPISFTWQAWSQKRFAEKEVAEARADLKALRPTRFTRNFLRFNTSPADLDWFDDFDAIASNAKLAASLARDGHCAGILFDTEQYQGHLFDFRRQRHNGKKTLEEYLSQVRKRGTEVMNAFQSEFPDAVIMLTFGHSMTWRHSLERKKAIQDSDYGLLGAFVDGMIAASNGRSRLVDGYELSYGFKTRERFTKAYQTIKEDVAQIAANPGDYQKRISVAFGIWMDFDWQNQGWIVEQPSKNYFTPETFENSVRAALERSDEFVWIYTETPRWWTPEGKSIKLPQAYEQALRNARNGIKLPQKPR